MKIALVTTTPDAIGTEDLDMPRLLASLAGNGIDAVSQVWHDRTVDWTAFDLVVIRSPWDYSQRASEFLEWLAVVSNLAPVLNCAHTIRWNLNKRYLAELGDLRVEVVPSTFANTVGEANAAIDSIRGELVVKPTVSAGAKDTGLFAEGDPAAFVLAESIIASNREVIVQQAVPDVAVKGETALVYFDGEFSHALRKGPILALGGDLLGGSYTESVAGVVASSEQLAVAQAALIAAQSCIRRSGCDCPTTTPLYARFDLVDSVNGPLLLEAELFEPSYFVDTAAGASERFAKVVHRRLSARR